ncbi:hypothetical protein BTUL_0384g00070 [Botrytis tulipae]|uniref:Uncharacterized protein n=1 Tax=Botrytis tulipae TaxID=87230 RepID=A0A4Z1E6G1_9HELO|nr:hypothetical protein BTUL_0384g00070 [Botrytis tulipae]
MANTQPTFTDREKTPYYCYNQPQSISRFPQSQSMYYTTGLAKNNNITIWITYSNNKDSPRSMPNGEFQAGMRDSKDFRPEVGW